ncbi:rhizopine catabolism protein [Pikeienuella piscinae]|uniref:Rhizopine catabolism protein n=1 Tax=Pikeienuella piscinae TaxID=2748098 RepID=A0A7M3T615_9RHOB|nr:fatty acid desaturase [Pikeienuella piscinae]QIE57446.1 rhizopine catabolism protein [Pikeienuella piscinae]
MDATFARRRILEPARLRALAQRSDLRGAAQALSHFGAILFTGWLLWETWGTWIAIPVFMVHGTLLNFLYAGQHELSHGTVFATKWLNEWLGRAIGFIQIFPRDFDQIQHFAHHRHTSDWERDGELAREPYRLTSYLLWLSGLSYWPTRIARILRFARGEVIEPYIRVDEEQRVIREGRWHLGLYLALIAVSLAFQSWALVILWIAPMFAMKWTHQLQNTIEHLGLEHSNDILSNTRSTRTSALMRWMCWQMQYHTAHHMFPSVPFWKLRDLNADIEKGIGGAPHRMGYIEFQIEVIRKLAGACSEADFPMNEVWIAPRAGGGFARLPAI